MFTSRRIFFEGFVAGLIGAALVAVWFLIADLVNAQAFYTPAMLGQAAFEGLRDPSLVSIAPAPVIMYSALHIVLFIAVGMLSAALVAQAEETPHLVWLLVVLFVVFEFGFYIVIAVLLTPLLRALAWINVALGNLIAAAGMGYFLWRARPRLRENLRAQPLGATGDRDTI